jgi:hypothetical protein
VQLIGNTEDKNSNQELAMLTMESIFKIVEIMS